MCIYTHVGCIIYAALSRVVVYMRAPVYMYEESCAHVFVCICAMHIYIYIYICIYMCMYASHHLSTCPCLSIGSTSEFTKGSDYTCPLRESKRAREREREREIYIYIYA